jgi:hypothetical protein
MKRRTSGAWCVWLSHGRRNVGRPRTRLHIDRSHAILLERACFVTVHLDVGQTATVNGGELPLVALSCVRA